MIRAVFLDIDDTLLSFSGYVKQAMKSGFAKFHLKPYSDDMFPVFERINDGLWRSLERGEITLAQLRAVRWSRIFKALGISFDGPAFEQYFRDQLFSSAIPEPGAMDLLSYLAGRYALYAASNGPYLQQRNRLKTGGMDGYFDDIFISERMGVQKPQPGFFDACFASIRRDRIPDLELAECMLIGDSLTSDIAGGKQYGMKTCLYQPRKKDFQNGIEPDYTVRKLEEVKGIL